MPEAVGLLGWGVLLALLAVVAIVVGRLAARLFVNATRGSRH